MSYGNYAGSVQAVILDWAGTAVDHGCRGPAAVFARAFEKFGLTPTDAEIRAPMGMEKRRHVETMLNSPRLAEGWLEKYGRRPEEADVDAIFAETRRLMAPTLADFAEPVPGCAAAIASLREKGVKIGSCTGYSRDMMTELLPAAINAGYSPDCLVTADEVPAGRPLPWMVWLNMTRLEVFPPAAVVKVGDTLADIKEGLNAGCWSVAVTRTSNALGLSAEEAAALSPEILAEKEANLGKDFLQAGAHYVISSIADLPGLVEVISACLANGRKP